ncbi:MAG TPA: TonB-dependent receptor [Steroidobacteraceae bacterium]|nr:TonB-dependent receptor [Steroidobacteraceae bacterium]
MKKSSCRVRSAGRSIGVLIAAGAAMAAQVPMAMAQEQSSASSLEEIVVTASRRAETLQDTALSVTVQTPADLAVGGLTSLQDVLDYSPGAVFSGGSAPTHNTITMRGVSQLTSSPTVGVYIDDIPIGSSTRNAAGAENLLDVMKAGMERVEIVKGPQGTSFGASSMGGLIRYVSGDPSLGSFGAHVSADLSSIAHGGSGQRYTGSLNAPIVNERLGVKLSGYYEDVGGFIDRLPSAVGGAAKDVNGYENQGGMLKLHGNLGDRFSVSLLGLYDETTFHGRNVVALNGTGPGGGPPFGLAAGPYDTDTAYSDDKSEFKVGGLTLRYEFGLADLISSTSYQERVVSSTTDLVEAFGPLIQLFCGCTVNNAPFTGAQSTDRFVQELRLVSTDTAKAAGKFQWTVGAVYSDEKSGNAQRLAGLPTNFLLLDVNIPSKLEELAGFADLTYFVTPDFDVSAGVRVGDIKASVAVTDGPEILLGDVPPTKIDDTVDTYSFSARYRPSDTLSLYARIASGYRPASANLPLQGASPIVETDTLWSYEVGAKGVAAGGRLSYDVTAWYLNWKNLQATVFVNGAMTGGNADSDVTAYGLESALHYSPTDRFAVTASAAYTDSTLDEDDTSAFGAVAGEKMPGVPEITWALRGDYTLPLANDGKVTFGAGMRYVGDRNAGFHGGTGANGATITPRIYNFVIDSTVVADLYVAYKRGPFGISLYGTNVFDEYGYSGGSARPGPIVRATTNVIQPQTIGATITWGF